VTALSDALAKAKADGRAALIGYLPVGYPDVEVSIEAMRAMVRGGADVVEVGVPYSDPVMDGPTIQAAAEPAVRAGVGLADALRAVPRSHPFAEIEDLGGLSLPAVVVASDDEADPEHPRAVGEAYAAAIPQARLITDEPGRSPVAWQGSQLSRIIAEVAAAA
jgi:hypothetical protein